MIDWTQVKTAEQKQAEAEQQYKDARITELKQLLANTDYVGLSDYDKSKPELLEQRQTWRNEIRDLEGASA